MVQFECPRQSKLKPLGYILTWSRKDPLFSQLALGIIGIGSAALQHESGRVGIRVLSEQDGLSQYIEVS